MIVPYIGNFEPPHSTENHVARALEHNGHEVRRIQENRAHSFLHASNELWDADFVLWTRTGWDWDAFWTKQGALEAQVQLLRRARAVEVPVVGYHLDIWWGLKRQHLLYEEPFFQCDLVVTADGGHAVEFEGAGINHHWMPPGVSLAECELGTYRDELASPLAFVGNWQGDYHAESEHRFALVKWLQDNFRRDCAFWPKPGEHALRGQDLRDLYASTQINVGDSCFVGTGLANYWSDRIPETLGRGGFLLHPDVPGLEEKFTVCGNPFLDLSGTVLALWQAYDWDQLGAWIEWALANPEDRRAVAAGGRAHVLKHHTYERRMEQLIDVLQMRELLKSP